jgi:hypothetical protein
MDLDNFIGVSRRGIRGSIRGWEREGKWRTFCWRYGCVEDWV